MAAITSPLSPGIRSRHSVRASALALSSSSSNNNSEKKSDAFEEDQENLIEIADNAIMLCDAERIKIEDGSPKLRSIIHMLDEYYRRRFIEYIFPNYKLALANLSIAKSEIRHMHRDVHRRFLQLSKSDEVGLITEDMEIKDHDNAEDVLGEYQNEDPSSQLLQFTPNLLEVPLHVLNDGTIEHLNRLRSYVKCSFTSIAALMTATYTSTLKEQGNAIFIKATSLCLFLSLFSNLVVMALSEGIQTLPRNCFPHQHKDHLYIFIYGSTFMLMLCGLFLLLVSNANYGPLVIFPVLALIIMIRLFLQGCKFGHTQSSTNYREHDEKLRYYSELSSTSTIATFLGLSTYILSSPIHSHRNGEVKPTEISLYIAVVTSLLLMHLSSVPPAVYNDNMRAHVMEAMRYLSYIMVGLLFLVVLVATGAVLRGVISTMIYIAGTMIFVVVIVINELNVQCARNKPVKPIELDSQEMVVVDLTFGGLMNVYSKYVDDRTKVDDHFFLLLVCMLCSCTAFITSLSKKLLVSDDGTTQGASPRTKMISSYTSYAFAFVAAVSFFLTW